MPWGPAPGTPLWGDLRHGKSPRDREGTMGSQASLTLNARGEETADAALPGSSAPPGQAHSPEEEKREGP